jgi:formiminoglutamase
MSDTSDPRLRDLLGRDLASGAAPLVALIGFPCDEGVSRSKGRTGAAGGPAAIRQALGRLTPDAEAPDAFLRVARRTTDIGDIAMTGNLERDQDRLGERIAPFLQQGVMVIVLGGGHETAYGHFLGYVHAGVPVSIVNWDAHCDVREPMDAASTSGTPFRQALEHPSGIARRYAVAGLQPYSVAASHLAFARAHGESVWRRDVTRATTLKLFHDPDTAIMASFDLDAVDRVAAPGVSAPNTGGLPVELWFEAAYRAGAAPNIRSADVVELNPEVDRDGQTAALAALTVWYLLKGVSDRLVAGTRSPADAT